MYTVCCVCSCTQLLSAQHQITSRTCYILCQNMHLRGHSDLPRTDMVVPRSRLKFGERAFSIAAPRAWNSIPADLRTTLNTATFKKNPKTFLFSESYSTFWLNSFVTFALLHCPFLILVYCIFLWSGWLAFAVSPSRLSLSLLSLLPSMMGHLDWVCLGKHSVVGREHTGLVSVWSMSTLVQSGCTPIRDQTRLLMSNHRVFGWIL